LFKKSAHKLNHNSKKVNAQQRRMIEHSIDSVRVLSHNAAQKVLEFHL